VEPVGQRSACDGCGVEITWAPILAEGRRYCCALCAAGGDCSRLHACRFSHTL